MPRACVLAEGWDVRSALGLHTEALARVLDGLGWEVSLALQNPRRACRLAQSPGARRGACVNSPSCNIPSGSRWPRPCAASGAALFWYHGVTPPELWSSAADRDVLTRSVAGTELAWYAHLAVCDSPFIAEELRRYTGYPAERVRVVPLGVDVARLAAPPPAAELEHLRSRWRLTGRRVLLYVGRIAGNKRVDLLIDALARLADRYPDLHLLVVGDTDSLPAYRDLTAQLQRQAADRGVAGRVTFAGRVEDVWPVYHLADAFVTASQHEGFGVPLVEAMAAGVPVVAGASAALPWVLGAAGAQPAAGLLCEPGDAASLAARLAQVLDDAELRRGLVERGRTRAQDFNLANFAANTERVLAEAVQLGQTGPRPAPPVTHGPLYQQADVALRDYRVHSGLPIIGPLVAWLRRNSTTHVKEAYLDRIVEQQVLFNRQLVAEIERLNALAGALGASIRRAGGRRAAQLGRDATLPVRHALLRAVHQRDRRVPGGDGAAARGGWQCSDRVDDECAARQRLLAAVRAAVLPHHEMRDGVVVERLALRYPWPAPYTFGVLRRAGHWLARSPIPAALQRPVLRTLSRAMPPLAGLAAALDQLAPAADLVHIEDGSWDGLLCAAADAARRHSRPLVVRPLMHLGDASVQVHFQMAHQVDEYRGADAVLALVSPRSCSIRAARRRCIAHPLYPDGRGRPARAGCAWQHLRDPGLGAAFRQARGITRPLVAFLGAQTYDKGAFTLALAAAALDQAGDAVDVAFAGPGSDGLQGVSRPPAH